MVSAALLVAALVAFRQVPAQAPASGTTLVEPPTPLLPHTAQLVDAAPDANLPADSAEAQAVLKEDGLKRRESRTVLSPGKTGSASAGWVTAYQFDDATGALAAYTYLHLGGLDVRAPGLRANPANDIRGMANAARKADGEVVFLSGTSVVRVNTRLSPESTTGLLKDIETGLPKIGGRKGLAPSLPTMLPAAGLNPASLRYALGPIGYKAMGGVLPAGDLGWDKSAEAATADYHAGRGKLTLLLYPTPQIAGDRGRVIEHEVNAAGPATFGTIKMRRVGPLLGITSGGLSDAQAIDLVGALKLNEEVTFDKKMPLEFHAEVRKTYTLLQSIAAFCGVTILAALVLGVFLGGARAGIRVLQGKPAASEPEFLSINLREKPNLLARTEKP